MSGILRLDIIVLAKDMFNLYHSVWKSQKKVSFNIASEASYVYILSGQKLLKNAKNVSILASFWKPEACGQTVLPDRSVLKGQKLVENAKIQVKHFGWFSNTVPHLKNFDLQHWSLGSRKSPGTWKNSGNRFWLLIFDGNLKFHKNCEKNTLWNRWKKFSI